MSTLIVHLPFQRRTSRKPFTSPPPSDLQKPVPRTSGSGVWGFKVRGAPWIGLRVSVGSMANHKLLDTSFSFQVCTMWTFANVDTYTWLTSSM